MSKETDKIRMIGIIPFQGADPIPVGKIPDGGTQVTEEGYAVNQVTLIHTVTATKTLYLSYASMGISNESAVIEVCSLQITDGADNVKYHLFWSGCGNKAGIIVAGSFMPPIEIPAGYKIKLNSTAADLKSNAFIHGYEI